MPDITITPRRKRLSTQTVTLRLVAASLIASAAIGGGMAIQMASGNDPALGAGTSNTQAGTGSGSASDDSSNDFGPTEDGSDDFGQAASPPSSVTTRSS
jgi:hypothetical protein